MIRPAPWGRQKPNAAAPEFERAPPLRPHSGRVQYHPGMKPRLDTRRAALSRYWLDPNLRGKPDDRETP